MKSDDGAVVVVYNGEIYNYIELRDQLRAVGAVFRTDSDTEVLLRAYEVWGEDCVRRFNGMFAFVLWDARQRQLFVARDRFGEKPLFWARPAGGGIAFASEMKALVCHPEVGDSIDEATLGDYTGRSYSESGEATMFANVRRFPAAFAAIVDEFGVERRRWRYWTPDYLNIAPGYDPNTAAKQFAELMTQSVTQRLRSDVPVGSSLSGGLDSSTIVCTLKEIRESGTSSASQSVFSARFDDDPTISEGPEIDRVVEAARVAAHSVAPDPAGLMAESQRLHWHQEEPFLSASIYLQWCVARLAREAGVTVLLDGQGADELLGGYAYFFSNYQLDRVDRGEFRRMLTETLRFTGRLRRASKQYVNSRRRFNAGIALSMKQLFGAWMRKPACGHGAYEVGVPPAATGWRLRRQLAEALQYNSLPALLRYADRNSMAFGREVRLPFLDYRLVDYCIGLPDDAYIYDGWQKFILRKAAPSSLPDQVRWRADKVGYAAPLDLWLRGSLREWAEERLFAPELRSQPHYDLQAIEQNWKTHQAGEAENSWALWRWISLAEWLSLRGSGAWRLA